MYYKIKCGRIRYQILISREVFLNIKRLFVFALVLVVLVGGLAVAPQVEAKALESCAPGYQLQISETGDLQIKSDPAQVAGEQILTVTVQSLDKSDKRTYYFWIPEHDADPVWETFGGVYIPQGVTYHWTIVGSRYCTAQGWIGPTPVYRLFLPLIVK